MSTEPQTGADPISNLPDPRPLPRRDGEAVAPAFTFPDLTRPEPAPTPPVAARPKKAAKPAGPIDPAASKSPIETEPEKEIEEEILPPSSIKGWVWSLAFHGVALLILGLWFFSPKRSEQQTIDSRLAGSPFGSDLGVDVSGGFDDTLESPQGSLTVLDPAELTKVLPAQVALDPSAIVSASAMATTAAKGGGGAGTTASGGGGGFGIARFGSGGESIQGVAVKVGDPQFTLIWDTKADLDIHVLEPTGSEIYWEARNGKQGGELDVDDIDGFGPENVYWVQGKGPPGEYKWFVQYYGGMGGYATPTRWKVRIKHDDKVTVLQGKLGAIGERSRVATLPVAPGGRGAGAASTAPPADISAWKTFSSPEGAFTVSIPEIPSGEKHPVPTPLGDLDEFRFAHKADDGTYAVAYLDYPAAAMQGKDPLTLLDDSTNGLVAAAQAQQQDLRRIALNGQPGREVQFQLPDKGVTHARLYLVKNRLYQVAAEGTQDFATSPEAQAFLRSFNFIAPK